MKRKGLKKRDLKKDNLKTNDETLKRNSFRLIGDEQRIIDEIQTRIMRCRSLSELEDTETVMKRYNRSVSKQLKYVIETKRKELARIETKSQGGRRCRKNGKHKKKPKKTKKHPTTTSSSNSSTSTRTTNTDLSKGVVEKKTVDSKILDAVAEGRIPKFNTKGTCRDQASTGTRFNA